MDSGRFNLADIFLLSHVNNPKQYVKPSISLRRRRSTTLVLTPRNNKSAPVVRPNEREISRKNAIIPHFKSPTMLLLMYVIVGSTCFYFLHDQMTGTKTNPILDALYFTIVTMSTGYGDLVPNSMTTKLLACAFVFVRMTAIALYMSKATDVIVEKQEILLAKASNLYMKGSEEDLLKEIESNKSKYKFYFTAVFLLIPIVIGTLFLWKVEKADLVDSFYCVWGTITILGYGGKSSSSAGGRVFAVFWVMITTVCVGQFFFYLTELTAELEQKRFARRALAREPTSSDFMEADIDGDGQLRPGKTEEIGLLDDSKPRTSSFPRFLGTSRSRRNTNIAPSLRDTFTQRVGAFTRFKSPTMLLLMYVIVSSTCFYFLDDQMTGTKTNPFLDALYFTIVTMSTGYGDLVPDSTTTKLLACAFVFVSMIAIALYLSQATDVIVEKQETLIAKASNLLYTNGGEAELLEAIKSNKVKYKFFFTSVFLVILVITGTLFLWKVEKVDPIDSFYCVWGTITILGYGGKSFSTTGGRIFAVFWVVITTVCVAQFFFYLAELTAENEQKKCARRALARKPTISDLLEADIDEDGQISATEFIIHKLKEMGKITQKDIDVILKQFQNYDKDHKGRLTVSDLHEI